MPNQYQINAAQRAPDSGIFAKAHLAFTLLSPKFHVAIRIVPKNQTYWRQQEPTIFSQKLRGQWFATIGAGPTGNNCNGYLKSGVNRETDLYVAPSHLERLSVTEAQEDTKIGLLFNRDSNFNDFETPYECLPEPGDDSYNSNGFARGLLGASGIPTPVFPVTEPSAFPGWEKPVPADKFD